MSDPCPFCTKDLTFRAVHSTALSTAFLSRDGIARGQCLVATKRHVVSLRELTGEELGDVFGIAKRLMDVLIRNCGYGGVNLVVNDGESAGQTVKHFHLHLIPRNFGDSQVPQRWLSDELWANWRQFTNEELTENAIKLRAGLEKF